jgi:hypothetical protein
MRRVFTVAVTTASACVMLALAAATVAPFQAEAKQQIAEANKLKSQVTSHINGRRYEQAAKSLQQLEEAVAKLKESGSGDKVAAAAPFESFIENQKKLLERYKPKQPTKKEEPGTPPAVASPAESSTTPGGISFVKDVAPIFLRNCTGCHGTNNPRSKFSLATFQSLMKGGERGDDIMPGKPGESLLVLLLKGEETPRMPRGNRALRADLIEKVETWVRQGAKFDGAPKFALDTPLSQIVPSADEELRQKVAAMSDSELLELHKAKANEHWTLANGSKSPETVETDHCIVMGTLPAKDLEQAGQWAESTLKDVARMFGYSPSDVGRGKLTIHLFADRYEYTEHAMVVEKREVPSHVRGHSFSMIETAYVAVPRPPEGAAETLKSQLTEQVVVAFLHALSQTPDWFDTGVARYLAARSDPKAEIYRQYRSQIREALAEPADAVAQIVEGKGGGDAGLLGFGLIDFLATQKQRDKGIATLGTQLRQKTPADKAIQTVYGMDRGALTTTWGMYALRYPVAKKR